MVLRGSGLAAGALAIWLAVGSVFGGGAGTPPTQEGIPVTSEATVETLDLDAYRWQNRIILIFAPAAGDTMYAQQLAIFATREAELAERDLLIGQFPADEQGSFAGQPVARAGGAALRERYDVAGGDFALILIGKDGGVKLAAAEPVSTARLFELIDSMPMRQQEERGE